MNTPTNPPKDLKTIRDELAKGYGLERSSGETSWTFEMLTEGYKYGFDSAVEIMKKRDDELFDRICDALKTMPEFLTYGKLYAATLTENKARIIGNE